jgi:hypothetical protein
MVDQLINSNEPIDADTLQNVFNHTAIIAHHRRHSKCNTVFSIFNQKLKSADSWRRFVTMINGLPVDSSLRAILDKFQPGKREAVNVRMSNDVSDNVSTYNAYRKLSK